jgi:hypothetical protein
VIIETMSLYVYRYDVLPYRNIYIKHLAKYQACPKKT